jgi:serine/threonine protein kinase
MTNSKSVDDPFGSWTVDMRWTNAQFGHCRVLSSFSSEETGGRLLAVYEDTYILKILSGVQIPLVQNELKMMLLAEECAVQPVGRIYEDERLVGFIMPYERVIAPFQDMLAETDEYAEKLKNYLTQEERLAVISDLCDLIAKLHSKGILHGDIKPQNLLRCADGSLRLCDFAEAMLETEARPPRGSTTTYQSPSSYAMALEKPLTKQDDLYATGITIWEIYTGRARFYYLRDQDMEEDLVRAGVRPDMSLVDDEWIARVIISYLDTGETPIPNDVFPQPWDTCVASSHVFSSCLREPPHTYAKVLHSEACVRDNPGTSSECSNRFTVPFDVREEESLVCVRCRPVQYCKVFE